MALASELMDDRWVFPHYARDARGMGTAGWQPERILTAARPGRRPAISLTAARRWPA